METQIIKPGNQTYYLRLKQMKQSPSKLYFRGDNLDELLSKPRVAIVGTRAISPYGRQVTRLLARQLAERGITIISGLALGVDAAAHQACLDVNGKTLAVLPSPVETIAPATNQHLAKNILNCGGGLLSTYPAGSENYKGNFVERNELVAALSDAVIVTEAGYKSGTRHTVKFALDLSVPVFVIPGNITSPTSVGANNILKAGEGQIMTRVEDVFRALGLQSGKHNRHVQGANAAEQCVLNLIEQGISDGSELLSRSQLSAQNFASVLTMLEITAKIVALGANHWALA